MTRNSEYDAFQHLQGSRGYVSRRERARLERERREAARARRWRRIFWRVVGALVLIAFSCLPALMFWASTNAHH